MDLENQNQEFIEEKKELNLTELAMEYLLSTAKWAKFLSILGLIGLGLMVVLGFSMGALMGSFNSEFSALPSAFFGIIYLFMAGIYIYPILAMLRFANFSKSAILNYNSDNLTEAFRNIKGSYQYVGILTIIGLSLYALFLLIAIIIGAAGLMAF